MSRPAHLVPAVAAGVALLHGLPSVTVLGALAPWQPPALPWGLCRWRGPVGAGRVAFTFDDGPSALTTVRTLELLADLDVRATFFVTGANAEAHPELLRRLRAEGHTVGLHGQRHRHHLLHGPWWVWRDLQRAVEVHRQVLGDRPAWFRPPYGQLSAGSVLAARGLGLTTVLWSGWGREFSDPSPPRVRRRLQRRLRDGAVFLQHDNDESCPPGTAAVTHQVLGELVDEVRARGLSPVTLDELVGPR